MKRNPTAEAIAAYIAERADFLRTERGRRAFDTAEEANAASRELRVMADNVRAGLWETGE